MLTPAIQSLLRQSVLCWLATCDRQGQPNVSPKEMFTCLDDHTLLIAHIASPVSVRNICENPNVCVSVVEIFVQKGYKLKGRAAIIGPEDTTFPDKVRQLTDRFGDRFPISALIEVTVTQADPILAPSYVLFPDSTTEESQIKGALRTYGVHK